MESPNSDDFDAIQAHLAHADDLVTEATGDSLDGSLADFSRLQALLDSEHISSRNIAALQSIGIALGKIFEKENSEFTWAVVDDEVGRAPALSYLRSDLMLFPQTLISKRVEAGESVNIRDLYYQLLNQLGEVIDTQYAYLKTA